MARGDERAVEAHTTASKQCIVHARELQYFLKRVLGSAEDAAARALSDVYGNELR